MFRPATVLHFAGGCNLISSKSTRKKIRVNKNIIQSSFLDNINREQTHLWSPFGKFEQGAKNRKKNKFRSATNFCHHGKPGNIVHFWITKNYEIFCFGSFWKSYNFCAPPPPRILFFFQHARNMPRKCNDAYLGADAKTFTKTGYLKLEKIFHNPALIDQKMLAALMAQSKSSHAASFFCFHACTCRVGLNFVWKQKRAVFEVSLCRPLWWPGRNFWVWDQKDQRFRPAWRPFPKNGTSFFVFQMFACTPIRAKNSSPKLCFFLQLFSCATGGVRQGHQFANRRAG